MDKRAYYGEDRDADYEYGYDYLYEEEQPAADTDEPDEDQYWNDGEEYEERELAAARERDIEESAEQTDAYWQDDDAAIGESEIPVESVLEDMPATDQADEEAEEPRKLKRQMKEEALARFERAARTEADFRAVTELWDRRDRNRERRERYREVLRGDVPLEYQVDPAAATIFPRWRNDPTERQLASGNFLDYLNDCPYELHDLPGREYLRRVLTQVKDEHREQIFFLYLRLYSPQRLACARGQTDRNIRKVRDVALRKIRKRVYRELTRLKERGGVSLTRQELEFLEQFDEKGERRT